MWEADFDSIKNVFQQLSDRNPVKIRDKVITKRIFAFDTETVDGRAVLVAASDGSFIFPGSFEEIAAYLTQRRFNSALNFFWNLDYDFFAITKWMPAELLPILYENKGVIYGNYFIRWIPRKFFSISRDDGKHRTNFFDLWQFYRMSLSDAARKYLGDSKLEIDVENIAEYLKTSQMRNKLISYCVKDAKLTAGLGEILQQKLNSLGIDFSRPYSCGYISASYFFKGRQTFGFRKTEWALYAMLAYYGGRFEVMRRGYFPRVYQYDINSAYPYYISRLTDPFDGTWIKGRDVDYSADYGFARILIHGYQHDVIAPLPWRLKNRTVIYPNFEDYAAGIEYYVAFPELQAAEKLGLEFDVLDSWAFYGTGELLFPQIGELYQKRREAKKNGDKVLELVLKIIMNSLYGKFAEKQTAVRASLKPSEDSRAVEVDGKKYYVRELNRPGLLFCPVLAAYITAQTRTQLLETGKGCFDEIIAFATDSILTTRPFIEESEKLGGWKLETQGEAIVLMSGVYTIRNDHEVKSRFRGFPVSVDFFELLRQNRDSDHIKFEFERAIKLGEIVAFHNMFDYDDLNIFRAVEKRLTCYGDEKRDWLGHPVAFGQLLERDFESVPRTVRYDQHWFSHNRMKGYSKRVYDWLRAVEAEETAWMHERMML